MFVPGAGANGCELAKLLATMGAARKGKGCLSMSDFDAVELSNLNRQMLFDNSSIGKNKALAIKKTL